MYLLKSCRIAEMAALACLACACSAPVEGGAAMPGKDDHFTCASLIGGADKLMASGKVAVDQGLKQRGLVAGMTHLNAYAIPKGLGERQAFDNVNAERNRLLATTSDAEIVARAEACIEQVPAN